MVVRSVGGKLLVRKTEAYGHNSGETFSDLEKLIRTAKIEFWPADRFRLGARSLRLHSRRKLAALTRSIATFGVFVPIVADPTGKVLSGRARLTSAIELGLRGIPVMVVSHLSDPEKRLFALADHRIPELSTWDLPMLKLEIQELSLPDPNLDLSLTGFDTAETDRILGSVSSDTDVADDEVPELESRATSQLGDLWVLGRHKVYCGSALQEDSYHVLLGRERVQMVITDPPWNVAIAGHVRNSGTSHREFIEASGEMSEEEFTHFLGRFLFHLKHVTEDGAIIYVFIDHAHSLELQVAAYPFFGKQKNLCVWAKDAAGMGSFYRSQHELVYVFKNGTAPHINNFNLGEKGRYRTNVWNYPGANTGPDRREALKIHPTVKPCAMFVDAMLDCSHRGGIVLDCFGGSGVSAISAERTGRTGRVMELDPLYVDLIVRRWQSFTGNPAIHAGTGATFDEMTLPRTGESNDR
jgi:DNA modification methylase